MILSKGRNDKLYRNDQAQSPDVVAFRFLDLPKELRTMVHLYLLNPAEGDSTVLVRTQTGKKMEKRPYILKTCRLIRAETLPIFYARYRFVIESTPRFHSISPLTSFTKRIGISSSHLRNVTITLFETMQLYLEIKIKSLDDFPKATITLSWPSTTDSTALPTNDTLMCNFRASLFERFAQFEERYSFPTDDALQTVQEIFEIGKSAINWRPGTGFDINRRRQFRDRGFMSSQSISRLRDSGYQSGSLSKKSKKKEPGSGMVTLRSSLWDGIYVPLAERKTGDESSPDES